MRSIIGPFADRLWREGKATAAAPFEFSAAGERAYLEIQALAPQNNLQRSLQARAAQLSTDLTQTRLLLFEESEQPHSGPIYRHPGLLAGHNICELSASSRP